jgi:hypothetical protein
MAHMGRAIAALRGDLMPEGSRRTHDE